MCRGQVERLSQEKLDEVLIDIAHLLARDGIVLKGLELGYYEDSEDFKLNCPLGYVDVRFDRKLNGTSA